MGAQRLVFLAFVAAALLGIVWFGWGAPVQAQPRPNPACAQGEAALLQLQREDEAARDALRLYWAQRHPQQLAWYRQELRTALAQQRVTPDFDRIAADLSFYVMPDLADSSKVWLQQGMLQLADRIAVRAPSSNMPLVEDNATAARLKLAAARASQQWQQAMTRQFELQCYGPTAPPAGNGANAGTATAPADTALFNRAPAPVAAAASLSTEPSAGLVCAETQQVLGALEREEQQAGEALRLRWALDNHENLNAYLDQLRTAQRAGSVAANFDRIADGLAFPLRPTGGEAAKLRSQAELLQLAERVAREFEAILDGRMPTPKYLSDDTPRDDLELSLERTRYQVELRRKRMADLNCGTLALPPVEPFARRADPAPFASPRSSGPNPAQVCAETAAVLGQLERDEQAAYLHRWAMADDYHDSFFAVAALRDAAKAGKVADDFDELARMFGLDPEKMSPAQKLAAQPDLRRQVIELASRVRSMTGRPRDSFNDPDAYDPTNALFENEDDAAPPVDPAVRRKEGEIEDAYQQARYQAELRRQRLKDLNCDRLPTQATASDNGTLQRHTTKLQQDHGGYDHQFTYGENWAELLVVGDPPDRRRIRWEFKGVPGSLSPGDEFTIKVIGELDFKPAGAERGANNAGGVRAEGLIPVREENGYFYQGASREGTYTYKVPLDAKRVVLELGADNNQGTFVRHCYGACTP